MTFSPWWKCSWHHGKMPQHAKTKNAFRQTMRWRCKDNVCLFIRDPIVNTNKQYSWVFYLQSCKQQQHIFTPVILWRGDKPSVFRGLMMIFSQNPTWSNQCTSKFRPNPRAEDPRDPRKLLNDNAAKNISIEKTTGDTSTQTLGWNLWTCGCFQKRGYPQIIHFNRIFHYKPSILGYPYFWKHPCSFSGL